MRQSKCKYDIRIMNQEQFNAETLTSQDMKGELKGSCEAAVVLAQVEERHRQTSSHQITIIIWAECFIYHQVFNFPQI